MPSWALLAIGALLLVLAGASLGAALFTVEWPKNLIPYGYHALLGRLVQLNWASDWGFLVAAFGLAVAGATMIVVAGRRP